MSRAGQITAGDSWTMSFTASSSLEGATVTWTATAERGSPDDGAVVVKTAEIDGTDGTVTLLPDDTRALKGGSRFTWYLRAVGPGTYEETIGRGVLTVLALVPERAS